MIKVERRGKYGGVKIHLDAEESKQLMDFSNDGNLVFDAIVASNSLIHLKMPLKLAMQMGKKINQLAEEDPDLLKDRTPEEVAAILAKESEKAGMQLNALKNGKDWKKVDPSSLKKALLKHVEA
jgi:hypothetical protein